MGVTGGTSIVGVDVIPIICSDTIGARLPCPLPILPLDAVTSQVLEIDYRPADHLQSPHHALLDTHITDGLPGQGDDSKVKEGLLHTAHTCRRHCLGPDARYPPALIQSLEPRDLPCHVPLRQQ